MNAETSLAYRSLRYGLLTMLLLSLAGVAISGVVLVVNDGRDDGGARAGASVKVMATSGVLLLAANVGLLCVIRIAEGRWRWLMWLTLAFTMGLAAAWIVAVWEEWLDRREIGRAMLIRLWSLTVLNAGLVTVGQLLAGEVDSPTLRWLRQLAAGWVGLLTVFAFQMFWTEWWWPWEEYVGPSVVVATVLTAVALGVIGRMGQKRQHRVVALLESIGTGATLRLTCPHCQSEQVLPSGLTRCKDCRRALLIEFEEPRCECGYLLFKLVGDACPECGRAVPSSISPRAEGGM